MFRRNRFKMIALLAGLAMACPVMGQTSRSLDARQAKVEAADADAVTVMLNDISSQPITRDLTVRDVLSQTNSTDELVKALKQAEQIGGPRWIDEQTCQVRLEMRGPQVQAALEKIVSQAGQQSPISADALKKALKNWDRRTFVGVGNSGVQVLAAPTTRTAHVAMPLTPPKWVGTLCQADGRSGNRGSKLMAARQAEAEAIDRLREQLGDLPLNGKTVGDLAKTDPTISDAIDRAVQRAKLTKIDYLADGGASVRVTLDLADLWQILNDTAQ